MIEAHGIVLSANFVTLAGMILGAVTALGIALLQQGRTARTDRDDIREAVTAGFKASTKQADAAREAATAAHDEIKTSNGHTAGEIIEKTAKDLAAHMQIDLDSLAELKKGQDALAEMLVSHVAWADERAAELAVLNEASKKKPTPKKATAR